MKVNFSAERLRAIANTLQRINEEELQSANITEARKDFWKLQGFFDYLLGEAEYLEKLTIN